LRKGIIGRGPCRPLLFPKIVSTSSPLQPPLSPVEARVLGVLVEKQHTVPDSYPLSLNAIVSGANQRSSRDPVMEVGESDVLVAIDRLKHDTLVVESSGGRVARYAHNAQRALQIPSEALALVAVLMLRGPQTPGELRANAERLHRFSDISSVEAYLQELAERAAGALVTPLARVPGAREIRWAHLLCGPVASAASTTAESSPPEASALARLERRVEALEAELAELRSQLRSQSS
jgi:uncharacterized protein YceH (UPF0502 family)